MEWKETARSSPLARMDLLLEIWMVSAMWPLGSVAQRIKASAKYVMFQDLENSLPGGPNVMPFVGFTGDSGLLFSAKKCDC